LKEVKCLTTTSALTTLLRSRIAAATAEGAKTVVLKNAGPESLAAAKDCGCGTISEDISLDFSWYAELGNLKKLLRLSAVFEKGPVLITEWLYVALLKFAPVFEGYFGKTAAINCMERFGAPIDETMLLEVLGTIFEIHSGSLRIGKFPPIEEYPLYPRSKAQEVNTIDGLTAIIYGKKASAFSLSEDLKTMLVERNYTLYTGPDPEVIIVNRATEKQLAEIDRLISLAAAEGRTIDLVNFTGYCPGPEARSLDLKSELKREFGFDLFKDYAVYGSDGTYSISQEEMIRYLIDQNYRKKPSDLFFVASTGSGKSLIYQLAAKILKKTLERLTVVITPLKALMEDQVAILAERFGERGAAFINSDMNLNEREELIEKLRRGEITILYVSPETFVGNSLSTIIADCRIGLMVIDEAHLVTTWGKTFRVDYGYLGEDLKVLRERMDFPVMATTATAISGGELDTVDEISNLLYLRSPRIIMTSVRRNNISFNITRFNLSEEKKESRTSQKISDTVDSTISLIESGKKSIVYCPFVGQADSIYNIVGSLSECRNKVGRYTGPTGTEERRQTQKLFSKGIYRTVIATKAFGMGIDVPDIDEVYHHSVPSMMADYVQEIGRAGRDGRASLASTHFNAKDLSDSLKLSMISVPEQWKMKHIMEHIGNLVRQSRNGEIVLSLDDIRYLLVTGKDKYMEDSLRDKARVAVFLIQRDLKNRCGKNILVRKGETYQYLYFMTSDEYADDLLGNYPEIVKESNGYCRKGFFHNEEIQSAGSIYKIDISLLWKRQYSDRTLKQLVWQFMNRPKDIVGKPVIPKIAVEVHITRDMDQLKQQISRFVSTISDLALNSMRKKKTEKEFFDDLIESIKTASIFQGISDLDVKLKNIVRNHFTSYNGDRFQTSFFKCQGELLNYEYTAPYDPVITRNRWLRKLDELLEYCNDTHCKLFLNGDDEHTAVITGLLSIMDILNMAHVKFSGGESCAVHLKCTDRPFMLNIFKNYSCEITKTIRKRIEREEQIMKDFFTKNLDDSQRWDFVEGYFLGKIY
jgi:ATP-dependent DNA helicase RecQ